MPIESAPGLLRGARILIVEDDFIVAQSLEFLLSTCGCEVVVIAPTAADALGLIEKRPCDAAILDIHLRGGSVAGLAEVLVERRTPFVFVTGYADLDMLPESLRGHPRLDKPVVTETLIATLATMLGRAAPG